MSANVITANNLCIIEDAQLESVDGGSLSMGAKIAVGVAVGLGCGGAIVVGVFAVAVVAGYLANN